MSNYLSKKSLITLSRIGDIMIPQNGDLPSYTQYGGLEHVDDLMGNANESDIADLNLALGALSFMPNFVLEWLLTMMQKSSTKGGGLWSLFRQLDFGLKGIILSTYYTEKSGAGYTGKMPLDVIGYKINRVGL